MKGIDWFELQLSAIDINNDAGKLERLVFILSSNRNYLHTL